MSKKFKKVGSLYGVPVYKYKNMTKKQNIETPEQKQYRETVEKIAGNIVMLSKAVSALLNGPLKKRTLVILLASSSGQSQHSVEQILKALEEMESTWLNK